MQTKQRIGETGLARTLVGVAALAAALAWGSFAAAAPGEGVDPAGAAGCGAGAVAEPVSTAPVAEWSSSRTVPGKPY